MSSNNAHPLQHHHGGRGARHHHHIFHVSPRCPFHRAILQPRNHSSSCTFSITYPYPQNPEPAASITSAPQNFLDTHPNGIFHNSQMLQDENEKREDEDEEEGDPIFVLTDEWRDFFAKSEAKRRLAKKQGKKVKK